MFCKKTKQKKGPTIGSYQKKKKRKLQGSVLNKVELLDKLKDGKSYATVGRHYGLNESTVRYIKKKREGDQIQCSFGFLWKCKDGECCKRQDNCQDGVCLSILDPGLTEKNYPIGHEDDLYNGTEFICSIQWRQPKEPQPGPSTATDADEFRASKGWFDRLRHYQIRSANFHGEATSADTDAAANYPETFKQLITENGYKPEQVFNMDETALFWKKMSCRTFIMKDEMKAPGFKAQKDRSHLLCAATLALKNKNALHVFLVHNSKAWITKVLLSNWFYQSFIPQAREYLREKGMPFQVLLLMDNAGGHAVDLRHEGGRIEFLPPNTTSLLQPMDQGVIRAFKALYTGNCLQQLVDAIDGDENFQLKVYWRNFTISSCLTVIHTALQDMKEETLNIWLWEDPSQEDEEDEGLTLKRLADLTQAAKQLQENIKSWDPYMVRALQFSNAIDSAMSTYKTLFTSMKKQRGQLPITMFITNIKKTSNTPREDTTPSPDS
uniref:DDE-1 domain-containing protein n=1 Tax=Oryzias sinensis TaxID=183150 RepID=A0A8C7Y8H1_9TELE